MSFKFGFDVDATENNSDTVFEEAETKPNEKSDDKSTMKWYESEEVVPTERHMKNMNMFDLNSTSLTVGATELNYIHSGSIIKILENEELHKDADDLSLNCDLTDVKSAETNHSDLLPGIYEGGAKIWECTNDLIEQLDKSGVDLKNKKVLDLGCGSGLLGIYALKSDATVHFQDYNKDVLETFTIPNVILNLEDPSLESIGKHKYYSGDWSSYFATTKDCKFDVILTSETIYNPDNQNKLLDTLDAKLEPNGTIYLAAKIYYFGVGGGIRQFEDKLRDHGHFSSEIIWQSVDGVQREILKIKRIL